MGSYPLQLIKTPIAPASRQLNPSNLEVVEAPVNFPTNATVMIRNVYPQVIPLLSSPKSVLSPDRVK